jgi:transposase
VVSTQVITSGATVQAPPVVQQLENVFAKLEDAHLLKAIQGSVRRGPKGYPVQVLWRCYIARYVLGLESTRELIRTLENNPFIAEACGIVGPVPHEATFSRFFSKLSGRFNLAKLKDVSRRLVRSRYADTPGFGQRVAIDSTTLKGWSNGGKTNKSDPEAGWSVKTGTQGMKESVYGWKLHLMVDCETELPIAAIVTPGNTNDVTRASHVLREARFTTSKFHPRFVMADAGYSSKELFALIRRQYKAEPIIKVNRGHKKLMERFGVWEDTVTWKALFGQRTAVERAFSRIKGQRSLNHIRVRRRMKVTAHCYLALIAMQVTVLESQ